ncbi:MAG: MarR family transcriptional regulator, partial [Candidatus Brocadia sp.]
MTSFLNKRKIRIFDFKQFAQPFRDTLIQNAQRIAQENNLKIEYIRKKNFRKEDRIAEIIKK